MSNLDTLLQQTEADLLKSFEDFRDVFNKYSDGLFTLEFTPANQTSVSAFLKGMEALGVSLCALTEAAKMVASAKGLEI